MKSRTIATLGLSALVLGSAAIGTAVTQGSIAFAGTRAETQAAKLARAEADKAYRAMAAHKPMLAIGYAEAAVRAAPQDAGYRGLLGQAYLQSGRFASARDAFIDTLSLWPNDARSALSLALAQTASGDWAAARKTLDDHADVIPVVDRGLAMALAGDPATAVELLNTAARAPGADAKARQNLALALALAGRWEEAKSVAALDVAPDELDRRITEWAAFAHPASAADQVASLLGVQPVADPGLPVALALNAQVPAKALASVDAFMPGQPAPAAVEVAALEPVAEAPAAVVTEVAAAVDPAPVAAPAFSGITFGERREVVQAVPVAPASRVAKVTTPAPRQAAAVTVASKAPPSVSKGAFYVQLGAYENAGVARDGWRRATRVYAPFAAQSPQGIEFKSGAASFYRLSVGGFARADAVSMCVAYRARGGNCFVRQQAGDRVAQWVQQAPRQLASR